MAPQRSAATRIRRAAQEIFGYDQLRPGQQDAIRALIDGHDTLAVMPTGHGKSAIYQVAAQILDGPTVIVSPLIALQRDQVRTLEGLDAGGAALVNSAMRVSERREVFKQLEQNGLEFIFLAPEQFANDEVLARITDAEPSLFVVDEAHCISEWGHDFRPDYLRLGAIIERLGHPAVLALTATAAPPVREEIVERLNMRDPRVIVRGFDRPNIWLHVERYNDDAGKLAALLERVQVAAKPGIVYVATRQQAENVAISIAERGIAAAHYHAGLSPRERERVQAAFMADELQVIVATTAFGMGIDKPNVRFVYHYALSDSVDTYYQELGRAGRDGEPAEARLFYRPEDVGLRRFFAASGQVDADQVEQVAQVIRAAHGPADPRVLLEQTGLSQSKLATAIAYLEDIGAATMQADGSVFAGNAPVGDELAAQVERLQERQQRHRKGRIEMVRGYAEVRDCRRAYLLNYFGESYDPPCGNCDNCEAGVVVVRDSASEPFALSSRVQHASLGTGTVMRYENDKIVVLFDDAGYKTLSVESVLERGLLQPAAKV